jgi:rsbT antagonist protein RsbS
MGEIPILQIGPLLLVTIQTELHDRLAEQLQEDILQRVRETEAEGGVMNFPLKQRGEVDPVFVPYCWV